ncbi:hypothetical protein TNCV_3540411 [Trichonephila clavipes]|nr:hypothetical protein TNCV_3540411 [Trichonephila clavipes]
MEPRIIAEDSSTPVREILMGMQRQCCKGTCWGAMVRGNQCNDYYAADHFCYGAYQCLLQSMDSHLHIGLLMTYYGL